MFTLINLSANCTISANAVITGLTSGATGIAHVAISGAADIALMQIEGAFQVGEALMSSVTGDTFGAGVIQTITTRDFATDVKQIYQDTSPIDYTADLVLNQTLILSGDISVTAAGTTLNGTNTKFTTELKVGDVVQVPSGAAGINEEFRITIITNNLLLLLPKPALVLRMPLMLLHLLSVIEFEQRLLRKKKQSLFIRHLKITLKLYYRVVFQIQLILLENNLLVQQTHLVLYHLQRMLEKHFIQLRREGIIL